jgi:hypothetical protein
MKFYFTILIAVILLSCGEDKGGHIYEIPNLKENLKAFIEAKKYWEKPTYIVLVNLEAKNDTLSVDIADTYPDIKEMKFRYDTFLFGHRIIFTGEKIKGFSNKLQTDQFPADIIEINRNKRWLLARECTDWWFRYKDGKLFYKETPYDDGKR